eukprot:CAMPEP_0114322026 /NCGR_PEP_ID=MMETSP0059-20121206/26977_1 /TAXON_ID=36894 /ORGANISM="Pyramimonas parkeae, Strain CCMP726" /LENGTH=35 /DNA_ID= /DNA_START= /DNA_END= /DNA_ORIENTATION=
MARPKRGKTDSEAPENTTSTIELPAAANGGQAPKK